MYKNYIKRILDFLAAFFGLLLLSPLFILVLIFLALANNGKPFFVQLRPGKAGRIFKIIKFKTMNDKKDADGELLPGELRITKMGGIVRKTSFDEIPQLINVLKGEMSLIGPRPLLPEYLELYSNEQFRRHELRPGITGWAQVNGRNTVEWPKRFALDVWYVEHVSFLLDCKILGLTVLKVFKAEGISSTTHATMQPFTGNNELP